MRCGKNRLYERKRLSRLMRRGWLVYRDGAILDFGGESFKLESMSIHGVAVRQVAGMVAKSVGVRLAVGDAPFTIAVS